jgi:hypothetical protein
MYQDSKIACIPARSDFNGQECAAAMRIVDELLKLGARRNLVHDGLGLSSRGDRIDCRHRVKIIQLKN